MEIAVVIALTLYLILGSNAVDPQLVPINCDKDTLRTSTCKGIQGHDVQSLPGTVYPWDGFCLIYNATMVPVPGLIQYSLSAPLCRSSSNLHGDGMYFNFQDAANYEVFYMYSRDSFVCIIGYVEGGTVYNTSTFPCPNWDHWDTWMEFSVQLNATYGSVSVTDGTALTHKSTFTPHFPLSAIGGPMIINSGRHYDFLEFSSSGVTTATCQTAPELCDPCGFAYNEVNQPAYPLPDNSNFLLWYSRALEMVYNSCYIKVMVESPKEILINVTSQVGTFEYNKNGFNIRPGDFYGERHVCVSNNAACIQVKAAGSVTNGQEMFEDRTQILVTIPEENFPEVHVNEALEVIYGDTFIDIQSSKFSMYLDDRVYGPDFGIYCYASKNIIHAEEASLNMCKHGSNDPTVASESINTKGWAVKFSQQ